MNNFFSLFFFLDKLALKVSPSFDPSSKTILLTLAPTALQSNQDRFSSTANDSYSLEIDDSKELISITGQGASGVFYGIQTLLALVNESGQITAVSIKDSPRFSYRGFMVDVARNFQSKQEIMKVLDAMAMYKMNKFHFHLSDSEGWRLEIPGLEELTTVREINLALFFIDVGMKLFWKDSIRLRGFFCVCSSIGQFFFLLSVMLPLRYSLMITSLSKVPVVWIK